MNNIIVLYGTTARYYCIQNNINPINTWGSIALYNQIYNQAKFGAFNLTIKLSQKPTDRPQIQKFLRLCDKIVCVEIIKNVRLKFISQLSYENNNPQFN